MSANAVIIEAIARRKCVRAIYNRAPVLLAPHMLYTRHDDLFVDAVTLERGGAPPREQRLGAFKLDGLGDVALDEGGFERSALFDPQAERYAGAALFAVEDAPAAID